MVCECGEYYAKHATLDADGRLRHRGQAATRAPTLTSRSERAKVTHNMDHLPIKVALLFSLL
jgi:hypothetical protein